MTDALSANDWKPYYEKEELPWDLGGATPALIEWVRENPVRGMRVLTPGCGRGHDAHFLSRQGARVVAADYAPAALEAARAMYPDSPVTWAEADVTQMTWDKPFDLVWEYTCFCALKPAWREAYLDRIIASLSPGGTFLGMTFNTVPDHENGPPFEIDPEHFRELLAARFEVEAFEPASDRSVKARSGREIWFRCRGRQ